MPKRNHKRPAVRVVPSPEMKPKAARLPRIGEDHLLWSFVSFDACEEWCDGAKRENEFQDVAAHLRDFECKAWNQVVSNVKRDHPIPLDKLTSKLEIGSSISNWTTKTHYGVSTSLAGEGSGASRMIICFACCGGIRSTGYAPATRSTHKALQTLAIPVRRKDSSPPGADRQSPTPSAARRSTG
jgi:hypothetical protein